jgi:uncharacterized protein YpiB (UPF0302 family)
MSKKSRAFDRLLGERRYKKLFVLSVEGSKTEPQYFAIFNHHQTTALVKCLKRPLTKSSPNQVLKKMQEYLKKESLKKTDEAWIITDKDAWTEGQLNELLQWSKKSENYGFALSNPNFEYWLLLHFEEGKGITNSQECLDRLKQHLPDYKKDINNQKITLELIDKAILRAKQRDINRANDLPSIGSTTVYRLIERIITHVETAAKLGTG